MGSRMNIGSDGKVVNVPAAKGTFAAPKSEFDGKGGLYAFRVENEVDKRILGLEGELDQLKEMFLNLSERMLRIERRFGNGGTAPPAVYRPKP